MGSFPIPDEKQGNKTVKTMLIENIVAHYGSWRPLWHNGSYISRVAPAVLPGRRGDDNAKEELMDLQANLGGQIKCHTLPLSGVCHDQLAANTGPAKTVLGNNHPISS